MEKTKKRHNPPIHDEDLAVSAFDRNNDAHDLEKLIKEAKTEEKIDVVKGEEALRKEFNYLIRRIFGENIRWNPDWRTIPFTEYDLEGDYGYRPEGVFELTEVQIKKIFGMFIGTGIITKKYVKIECDLPKKEKKISEVLVNISVRPSIFENNQYNPIQITAYTPEALKQSKVFAQVYEKISGHPVKIIQECEIKEELEELIPKLQVRNIEDIMKGKEVYQLDNGKHFVVGLTREAWGKEYLKLLNDIFSPEFYAKDDFAQGWIHHMTSVYEKKWFGRKKVASIARDNLSGGFPSDLIIEVYSEKALPKSIEFCEVYRKLTNQNASVRKNF